MSVNRLGLELTDVNISPLQGAGFNYKYKGDRTYWIRFEFIASDYRSLAYGLITDEKNILNYITKYKEVKLNLPTDKEYDLPGKYENTWLVSRYLKGYQKLLELECWKSTTFDSIKEEIKNCIQELDQITKNNNKYFTN